MKRAFLAVVAALSFGAVLGSVSWCAGEGAATGAAIGGTGAVVGTMSAEEQYKSTYVKFLEGRGRRVLN